MKHIVKHCVTKKQKDMEENDITHEILDSTYKVHSALGLGLLESAYEA